MAVAMGYHEEQPVEEPPGGRGVATRPSRQGAALPAHPDRPPRGHDTTHTHTLTHTHTHTPLASLLPPSTLRSSLTLRTTS